jgi:hypothetical protein
MVNKNRLNSEGFGHVELTLLTLVVIAIIGIGIIVMRNHDDKASSNLKQSSVVTTKNTTKITQPTVNEVPAAINPINPKSIPIGDGKVSSKPEIGYVDACSNLSGGGGAETDGPWIDTSNGTWNSETKTAVQGSISWPNAQYSVTLSGNSRMIMTNDLPINHPTDSFPISKSDPAYPYDHNPNHIAAQSTMWNLPATPTAASSPGCTTGGPVGILNDGVFLFNALDGENRDAGAHEVLDSWQGHPDQSSMYHHHTVPTYMISAASPKSSSGLVVEDSVLHTPSRANGMSIKPGGLPDLLFSV